MSHATRPRSTRQPRKPRFTIEDAWRAAADPPSSPSLEEKAYLDWLDRQETSRRNVIRVLPQRLLEDARKKDLQADGASTRGDRLHLAHQARLLEKMATCLEQLRQKEQDGTLNKPEPLSVKYKKLVMRAARNGLLTNPLVRKFVTTQQAIGAKEVLKLAKIGLAKDAKLTWTPAEFDQNSEIVRLRCMGHSYRAIQRILTDKNLLLPGQSLSPVAIRKRINQLRYEFPWNLVFQLPSELVSVIIPSARQKL